MPKDAQDNFDPNVFYQNRARPKPRLDSWLRRRCRGLRFCSKAPGHAMRFFNKSNRGFGLSGPARTTFWSEIFLRIFWRPVSTDSELSTTELKKNRNGQAQVLRRGSNAECGQAANKPANQPAFQPANQPRVTNFALPGA